MHFKRLTLLIVIALLAIASCTYTVSASALGDTSSTTRSTPNMTLSEHYVNAPMPASAAVPSGEVRAAYTTTVGASYTFTWSVVDPPSGAMNVPILPTIKVHFTTNTPCDIWSTVFLWGYLSRQPNACPSHDAYFHHSDSNINCYSNGRVGDITFSQLSTSLNQATKYYFSLYSDSLSPSCTQLSSFTTTQTAFTIATSTTTPTTNVPFTLTGTLKSGIPLAPLTYKPVHLERRTGTTGTWATVAGTTKKTNSKGQVQVTQMMSTAGTYQYRWHYIGTATYPQAYSAVVTETVKKPTSMVISTSPTTPKFNQLFTVGGLLKSGTTPLAGYYVHLERKIGSGSWATVAGTTKKTGTGGLVFVKQTMTTHHTYYYRWRFTGTATYQPCYSLAKMFTM